MQLHLARNLNLNFPMHLAAIDSIKAHLDGTLLCINIHGLDSTRARARDILKTDPTNQLKIDGIKIATYNVENEIYYLVADKYLFSESHYDYNNINIQTLFIPFKDKLDVFIGREWYSQYPRMYSNNYRLVNTTDEVFIDAHDGLYKVVNIDYDKINCLADLFAYCYYLQWDSDKKLWVYNDDPHYITKQIRTPWFRYLCQIIYGEPSIASYDALVGYESPNLDKLKELYKRYESNSIITKSSDINTDPLFNWEDLL